MRRKIARRLYFALPRCARDKEETGTILSLAWQKRRFARSGLGSEACKPARLRRPAQVCRSDRAQNGVAFGNNTTPACRQDGMTCAACIDGIVIILAARFCAVAIWRGHLFRHYAGRFASFARTAFALCSVQLAKIRPRMVRAPRLVLFTFWFAVYDNASAMVRGRTPPKVRA